MLLTVGSAVVAFRDPGRGDMVAALGEVTGGCAVSAMRKKMEQDPIGRELLRDKPRIRLSTYPENLHLLPRSTFGGAYYHFMSSHGYSADERTEVRMIEDDTDAYVMQRYREVHDFWHVLSGIETNVLGELAVKWLEMVQTGLPSTALSAFVGPLRCTGEERRLLIEEMIPWALRCGRNSKFLMNIRYEDHWEDNIDDFRKFLNFEKFIPKSLNNTESNSVVL
eukprot:gene3802-4731_t